MQVPRLKCYNSNIIYQITMWAHRSIQSLNMPWASPPPPRQTTGNCLHSVWLQKIQPCTLPQIDTCISVSPLHVYIWYCYQHCLYIQLSIVYLKHKQLPAVSTLTTYRYLLCCLWRIEPLTLPVYARFTSLECFLQ